MYFNCCKIGLEQNCDVGCEVCTLFALKFGRQVRGSVKTFATHVIAFIIHDERYVPGAQLATNPMR